MTAKHIQGRIEDLSSHLEILQNLQSITIDESHYNRLTTLIQLQKESIAASKKLLLTYMAKDEIL